MSAKIKTTKKSVERMFVEQNLMWSIGWAIRMYQDRRTPANEQRLKAKIEAFNDYINRFQPSSWLRERCFKQPGEYCGFWWLVQPDHRGVLHVKLNDSPRFEYQKAPVRAQLQLVNC